MEIVVSAFPLAAGWLHACLLVGYCLRTYLGICERTSYDLIKHLAILEPQNVLINEFYAVQKL